MSETPIQKAINDGHHWLSVTDHGTRVGCDRAAAVILSLVNVATELYVADNSAELARKDAIIAELKRGLAEKIAGSPDRGE
jgi:hypothetical protein